MRRRDFLTALAAAGAASQVSLTGQQVVQSARNTGRLKQGVMRNQFPMGMSFEDMCRTAAELGLHGFDLIGPDDWPTLKKYGLRPLMGGTGGVSFERGMLHPEDFAALEKSVGEMIDTCAAGGCPNIITVGGMRMGMSYEEGAGHCVAFMNRIKAHLEDKNVTMCIEVMNNKLTNPQLGRVDQICNHLPWAVGVIQQVNSPRVRVLCDIYHVQIMDGDIVRNIRENIEYISHFHTGGVPDRHELDDTQEINYRFVAKAIADLGFQGYVTHEYRPAPGRDPIESLKQTIEIMRV